MLTKISDVRLFVGITDTCLSECYACRDFLDQESITYAVLSYPDYPQNLEQLNIVSGYPFAPTGETKQVTDFPFIMWKEYWDDVEGLSGIARNLAELQASVLIQNKGLIV